MVWEARNAFGSSTARKILPAGTDRPPDPRCARPGGASQACTRAARRERSPDLPQCHRVTARSRRVRRTRSVRAGSGLDGRDSIAKWLPRLRRTVRREGHRVHGLAARSCGRRRRSPGPRLPPVSCGPARRRTGVRARPRHRAGSSGTARREGHGREPARLRSPVQCAPAVNDCGEPMTDPEIRVTTLSCRPSARRAAWSASVPLMPPRRTVEHSAALVGVPTAKRVTPNATNDSWPRPRSMRTSSAREHDRQHRPGPTTQRVRTANATVTPVLTRTGTNVRTNRCDHRSLRPRAVRRDLGPWCGAGPILDADRERRGRSSDVGQHRVGTPAPAGRAWARHLGGRVPDRGSEA